ncbi:hypothetical protein, partial [Spiroplasma endosymbiont of Megaselia nigra]|uniref:hypothetical protein n=1 Tax=Spiroplasma endosymbiont of Megaselia nigra TaxID=2478537 RepID=UPI000FBF52D2
MIKSFKIKKRRKTSIKKLLSLLSVLTISGTAVPATIAASPYQKEEIKIENSDINFQTNNLNRIKRQQRKINISLTNNWNRSLGTIFYDDESNIMQGFVVNNLHNIDNLSQQQQYYFNSYMIVENINRRAGRATIYFSPNNSFEGTLTVVWNRSGLGTSSLPGPD